MTRALFLSALLLGAAPAGVLAGTREPAQFPAELLSGLAFGLPVDAGAPLPPDAVVSLDDEMRAFVRERVGVGRDSLGKLHRLVDGMTELGLFSLDYSVSETLPTRESFHSARGNCLSFTLLFVALARAAGLEVSYQIVDVPPTWSEGSDLVVVARHIDALIQIPHVGDYIVDFNAKDFETHYPRHVVNDQHALALFYNNLGAEALMRKDYARSFRYLRASLGADPAVSGAWANLGLLYWRIGRSELAEAAYRQALEEQAHDGSALTNLATLYTELGRTDLAAEYRRRMHNYQLDNPYYHYALAERAYASQRFDDALRALRSAIRLKDDDQRFYELQSQAYLGLGRTRSAARSLERARSFAPPDNRSGPTTRNALAASGDESLAVP